MIPESKVIRVNPTHSLTYDGATLNIFHANKGEGLPAHQHTFAHATMCHAGSCWVRKEGKELLIDKNSQPLNLVANEWHEIEAAEDGTVFVNVFAEGKY
jgi:quercetin dioxygenase-like cupin family protein